MWMIGIDEVRDLFSAPENLAQRLRSVARDRFPPLPQPAPHQGLLSRLGPLVKRPAEAPHYPVGSPLPAEVDAVMTGRHLAPERIAVAWTLVAAWLDDLSWSSLVLPVDAVAIDRIDFDLARAGVTSQFDIRHLWHRDARIGLRPCPGMEVGYLRHDTVAAVAEAWSGAVPRLDGTSRDTVASLCAFLSGVSTWTTEAAGAGRNQPDLFCIWNRA